MRLSYGIVRENRLTCLYHGWTYAGDGTCSSIPAHPDLAPPKSICVPRYKCSEAGGIIWVAQEAEPSDPPAFDGEWSPCRSLHFSRNITAQDLAEGMRMRAVTVTAAHISEQSLSDMLIAVQPMAGRGVMVHLSLPAEAPPDTHHAASAWLVAKRLGCEATTV